MVSRRVLGVASTNRTRTGDRYRAWLSEGRRSGVASVVAVIAAVVVGFLGRGEVFSSWDGGVLVILVYLIVYLVVTVVVFAGASSSAVREWAVRGDRGTVMQRYVLGTAPGPGVSLFAAAGALVVAVFWLPGHGGTTLPPGLRIGLAVALVVVAWTCIMVSFAVTFRADNLIEGEKALDFPGDHANGWSDYIYFSVATMSTFGTTDVNVRTPSMRRTVTVASLIAFVFNTVTVAALVSGLVSGAV